MRASRTIEQCRLEANRIAARRLCRLKVMSGEVSPIMAEFSVLRFMLNMNLIGASIRMQTECLNSASEHHTSQNWSTSSGETITETIIRLMRLKYGH